MANASPRRPALTGAFAILPLAQIAAGQPELPQRDTRLVETRLSKIRHQTRSLPLRGDSIRIGS